VSAGLAQVGEFSFILIGFGLSLQLVPQAAQDLVLAGAIISIALNPFAFAVTPAIELWIRSKPRLYAWLDRSSGRVRDTRAFVPEAWSGHAVIVGHGRVGSIIAAALRQNNVQCAVVEMDRKLVERLTLEGVPAVVGDIADTSVHKAVGLDRAALLAFAIPDNLQLRHALAQVRAANPTIQIIARTHSIDDVRFLQSAGVGIVLMSERELGLKMAQHALAQIGIDRSTADRTMKALRAAAP
jgi:CPA2 family monovalent cation:H+ antiporter-2